MSALRFPNLPPSEPQGCDLLAQERAKTTFSVHDLSTFLYGELYLERQERLLALLENEPAFNKSERYFKGRSERFADALRKDHALVKLSKKHNWTQEEYMQAEYLIDEAGPFGLHRGMFMPTLASQSTPEQLEKFLEPALRYEIIGCYAQTELGHGSNVQGIETTATYIPQTDEFEIHTPYLTACKWWIGGLGKAANHAVVMARLKTDGKDYGPHSFVVPIRSMEDHTLLPGVMAGDIGPKFGYNTTDNGCMWFNHYRVPRISLLAKYSSIKPGTGEYIKPPNAKLSYGTMVLVRASLVGAARQGMAKAVTIATRYSAIRCQFVDKDAPKKLDGRVIETPVLDYSMQQYRLFPIIASAYACFFTSKEMMRLYYLNMKNMASGDFSMLADVHASSSGLKSLTTTMAAAAIEECRRACGGHGFSSFSGLPLMLQDYGPNVTWEGDNYMITQQTGRYLFKSFRELVAKRASGKFDASAITNPTLAYLNTYLDNPHLKCPATSAAQFCNPDIQLAAFGHRAAHIVAEIVYALDVEKRTWNSMLVEIYNASVAHCQLILVQNFILGIRGEMAQPEGVPVVELSATAKEALTDLSDLFALHMIHKQPGEFLTCDYLDAKQVSMVGKAVMEVMETKIRPNAVGFVDAFAFPDFLLNSALGRYDGKVYEAYTEMATREPLNRTEVVEGYEQYIKPFTNPLGKKVCTFQLQSMFSSNQRLPPRTKDTPVFIMTLPIEIILQVFISVARVQPTALTALTQVCVYWRRIVHTHESVLWRMALLSKFPLATFDPANALDPSADWRHLFRIHHGWQERQAQSMVVGPTFVPETISLAIGMHPLLDGSSQGSDITSNGENSQQLHQYHQHHHHHQHSHHDPLPKNDDRHYELTSTHLLEVESENDSDQSLTLSSLTLSQPFQAKHEHHPSQLPLSSVSDTPRATRPTIAVQQPLPRETLACSLCTYSDLCVIPQAGGIIIRTHRDRSRPLMEILDSTMHYCMALPDGQCHQDLVSAMAVNDEGTFLATSSIDATVRVWAVQQSWRASVAIQNTTVVSGGSDHTVRVWDAHSGECCSVLSGLYMSRDLGLGVYSVAIHGTVIGSGSVMEGYRLNDVRTGVLLADLDEPLSSKEHYRFEAAHFQHYASRIIMTETVVLTNSKLPGLLCVWDRATGKLMYRIHACPPSRSSSSSTQTQPSVDVATISRAGRSRFDRSNMITLDPDDMIVNRGGTRLQPTSMNSIEAEESDIIHTFKLTSSGSMLMCTLCDGRVSLFEFGTPSQGPKRVQRLLERSSPQLTSNGQQQHHPYLHRCGNSAWIWTKDDRGQQHVQLW
ncbi:hypothetical protein BGZ94_009698 [Podila epigama]|nr:hypothetical protein BGZ94_009698 [Podila epigama]